MLHQEKRIIENTATPLDQSGLSSEGRFGEIPAFAGVLSSGRRQNKIRPIISDTSMFKPDQYIFNRKSQNSNRRDIKKAIPFYGFALCLFFISLEVAAKSFEIKNAKTPHNLYRSYLNFSLPFVIPSDKRKCPPDTFAPAKAGIQPGSQNSKQRDIKIDPLRIFPKQHNQVLDSSYLRIQADSLYLKGERAFSRKQGDKGIRFLKQAILYNPKSVHLRRKLAEYYTKSGLWAEASVQYEALLKQDPLLHSLRRRLIEIYAFNDLTQAALKHYKILLKKKPENFPVLFQYALLLMKDKKWPQALKALKKAGRKAVEANQKVEILLAEISVYGNLYLPEQQKKRLAEARFLQPDREDLALKLAWLYTQFGKSTEAINVLKDYQRRQHQSIIVTQSLADLFMVLNKKMEAREQLLKLNELGVLDSNRFFYLAALLIEQEEYKQAIPYLQDLLIHPSPFTGHSRYLLGTVYEKQGQSSKALKEYKNISRESAYFVSARIRQAQILREQGRDSKALNLLKPVIFTSGNIPQALLLYTHLLWKKNQKNKSLNILTEGLKHFPQNRDLLFLRGLYLSRVGKFQEAMRDMEQILTHNPRDGETLHFLTSLYIKKSYNLNRAAALTRKALSFHPNSRSTLDILNGSLFQKEDFEPALKYLNQAYSENNQSSYIASHLGEIYYQLRDLKKSRFYLEKAALLETNEKQRKAIQNRARLLQAKI